MNSYRTFALAIIKIKFCYTNSWISFSILEWVIPPLIVLNWCLILILDQNRTKFVRGVYVIQIQDAQTVCSIFQDNPTLCSEVSEKVIQHFVHCIETHGRHVQYLKFLQTIVKAENQFIRRCQEMVMQELINAGEDVLVFYNDKASFNSFVEMMRSGRHRMDESSPLRYLFSNLFQSYSDTTIYSFCLQINFQKCVLEY